MSALTEKVAREHASQGLVEPGTLGCVCGHRSAVSPQARGRDLGYVHLQHVAEIAEAAVRAQVAAEIERAAVMETCSCPDCDCGGTNFDRIGALYDAAQIAEGVQP